MDSPLGSLYLAASDHGLCRVSFGISLDDFLSTLAAIQGLDSLTCAERDPAALAPIVTQLREYFSGARLSFEASVDLSRLTAFQRSVLEAICGIPAGTVWTYRQVAQAIGKPRAGRAVGQALAHNPMPIIIPCHRVVASDGSLGGYSGGGGLNSKRLLLRLEGVALLPAA